MAWFSGFCSRPFEIFRFRNDSVLRRRSLGLCGERPRASPVGCCPAAVDAVLLCCCHRSAAADGDRLVAPVRRSSSRRCGEEQRGRHLPPAPRQRGEKKTKKLGDPASCSCILKGPQGQIDLGQRFHRKTSRSAASFQVGTPGTNSTHCRIPKAKAHYKRAQQPSGPGQPTQHKGPRSSPVAHVLHRSDYNNFLARSPLERRRDGEPYSSSRAAPSRRGRLLQQTAPAPGQRRASRPCPAPEWRPLRPRSRSTTPFLQGDPAASSDTAVRLVHKLMGLPGPRWKKGGKDIAAANPMSSIVAELQASLRDSGAVASLAARTRDAILQVGPDQAKLLNRAAFGRAMETAGAGAEERHWFQLGREEVFFLCHALKCVEVESENKVLLGASELWDILSLPRSNSRRGIRRINTSGSRTGL